MSSSPHMSRSSIDILEELQLITAENLEKLDFNKYYEVIRELGKGTYGKVDLVIHKIRGRLKELDRVSWLTFGQEWKQGCEGKKYSVFDIGCWTTWQLFSFLNHF